MPQGGLRLILLLLDLIHVGEQLCLNRGLLHLHLMPETMSGLHSRLRPEEIEDGLLLRLQIHVPSVPISSSSNFAPCPDLLKELQPTLRH